jgi:hypothetical protein
MTTAMAMLRAALPPRHLILSTSTIDPRTSECLLQTAAAAAAATTATADNTHNLCRRSMSANAPNSSNYSIRHHSGSKSARLQDYESNFPCHENNLFLQSRRNLHHDLGDYSSANDDRPKQLNSSVPPPNNNVANNTKKEENDNSVAAFNPEDGPPRTSVLMELIDRVGALHDVLKFL